MSRNLPYNRADRIASQIYEVIAAYIYRNVDDNRLTGIQITNARLTRDLSLARIYFYIDGSKDRKDAALKAMEELRPELIHQIAQELVLKTLPKMEFYIDEGVENAERIGEILKTIKT